MRSILYFAMTPFATAIAQTAPAEFQFVNQIPNCKSPNGRALPEKYYQYEWAPKVKSRDSIVGGHAEKKFDDPNDRNYLWHEMVKADMNGDGWCDWIVTSVFPLSTGGDRDSINTFYLGRERGWIRIGAELKGGVNSPDGLGSIKSIAQQNLFNFFDTVSFVYEKTERRTYLIGMFADRHVRQPLRPGYHIYYWDKNRNGLVELDKWPANLRGTQAYSFFKKSGASTGDAHDPVVMFEPDVEKSELEQRR